MPHLFVMLVAFLAQSLLPATPHIRMSTSTSLASGAAAKPGALIVTGVLRYQACDDTICYNPVTAPVSWTVTVK